MDLTLSLEVIYKLNITMELLKQQLQMVSFMQLAVNRTIKNGMTSIITIVAISLSSLTPLYFYKYSILCVVEESKINLTFLVICARVNSFGSSFLLLQHYKF